MVVLGSLEMGVLGKTPRLIHSWGAKLMGATMWCWILWRFKHDWRDVLVCSVMLCHVNMSQICVCARIHLAIEVQFHINDQCFHIITHIFEVF